MLYRSTREPPRSTRLLRGILVVAAVAILVGAATARVLRGAAAWVPSFGPRPEPDAGPMVDESTVVPWCAAGLLPIAGGGCLAVPTARHDTDPPAPLVIYLHGVYEQDHPDEELDRQHRVAARGTSRGFAVLALRSGLSACHPGVADFAGRFCWPSNEQVADRAQEFVDGWSTALRAAEKSVGHGPRVVLGFSSGGYFAVLLAARSLFAADAFVVAHAGPVEPIHGRGVGAPILLLSADDDVAQGEMVRLDDELTREGWPHDHRAREGTHGLTDSDIDLALAFATRVPHEGLPLRPPLSGHAPRWREREAGDEGEALAATEAGGTEAADDADAVDRPEADAAPPFPADDSEATPTSTERSRDADVPHVAIAAPFEGGTADPTTAAP